MFVDIYKHILERLIYLLHDLPYIFIMTIIERSNAIFGLFMLFTNEEIISYFLAYQLSGF